MLFLQRFLQKICHFAMKESRVLSCQVFARFLPYLFNDTQKVLVCITLHDQTLTESHFIFPFQQHYLSFLIIKQLY